MRIVSLVPSLTKTLVDFGLRDQLVGITNFCVDPPDLYRSVARIGGTKNPDLHALADLQPTHVIVNSEENRFEDIETIRNSYNMLATFPKDPGDVPQMLIELSRFLGVESVGIGEANRLKSELRELETSPPLFSHYGRTFAYLIWRDPWMAVSQDTYISKFLNRLGLENVIQTDVRYPEVLPADVDVLRPDVIFMSSEPWPFRKRDAAAWRTAAPSQGARIMWIDGKFLSWYGTSTIEALRRARIQDRLTRNL